MTGRVTPEPERPRAGAERLADPVSERGFARAFALLSVPFVLFTIGVVYLVVFSDLSDDFTGLAADRRDTAVRYAIEHTAPADVPLLLLAESSTPERWDERKVAAVVGLVERSGWPAVPLDGVSNEGLLARPPSEWSGAEADSVAELLLRFRSFHSARRR